MIPKKLHVIWVGDESLRPDNCIATWRERHPDWEFRLWGNRDLAEHGWTNAAHMRAMARKELNGVADMMRWEILYDEGGVVVDADSVCVRRLDDWLLECEAFACWENEIERPGLIAAGYVGSVPANPFFGQIVLDIEQADSVTGDLAWRTVGPLRLTSAHRQHRYDRLTILPSHFFIPEHFTGLRYEGSGPVYALQEWASTRRSYDTLHRRDFSAAIAQRAAGSPACSEIPEKLHWIWLGPQPMPQQYQAFIEQARAMHPGWECRVWRDDDIAGLSLHAVIERAPTWAGKADIARYEILLREGGFYLDCDVELLRPLDSLRERGGLLVCNEDAHFDQYCSIGMIAAPVNHAALRRAVERLAQLDPAAGPPNRVTGPWFWRGCLGNDHTLLPIGAFYPYLYDEPPTVLADRDLSETFGIHHWFGSWLSVEEQTLKATAYLRNGHYVAAIGLLETLLGAHPERREVIECAGYVRLAVLGRLSQRLMSQSDSNPDLLFDVGTAFQALGSAEAVLEMIERSASQARCITGAVSAAAMAPARTDAQAIAARIRQSIRFRPGTDDDRFVMPELLDHDMFRFAQLARLVPDRPVSVIDCGAHIGVFSMLCAEHLPGAVVHAFEPQPDNFELLRHNARGYGQRVVAHPQAVGTEPGRLRLYRSGQETDGCTGRWSMVPAAGDACVVDSVEVEVIDLAAFIGALDAAPCLLKLDLEGFEADLIAAMPIEVLRQVGILVLEEHHRPIDHAKLRQAGLELVFNPLGSDRHFVYVNPAALV